MADMRTRVNLLRVGVDVVALDEAADRIDSFVRERRARQIVTANLDFLRLSLRDQRFHALINSSDLVVADGMPLVWASRLLGQPLPDRVAGVDLVNECARLSQERGRRIFFLGAAPGVAETAVAKLRERFPAMYVAGIYAPDLRTVDEEMLLARIRDASPDILLVAFGAPVQDEWIRRNMAKLEVPVSIGVGGSFDMIAGRVSRAPMWMQRSGMEWLHRLTLEPGRLWKRYFVHDLPVFFRLMVASSLGSPGGFAPANVSASVTEAPQPRRLPVDAARSSDAS